MADTPPTKEMRQRAGHQEILGETLAKFEFFQHGWHPYSRFLDVDKVDLLLRRRRGKNAEYREIQVKYGKLYECTRTWELELFSVSSWRFFTPKNLDEFTERPNLFLAYVLSPDDGFKSDLFILPAAKFATIVRQSDRMNNGNYRVYISKSFEDGNHWYIRRVPKFTNFDKANVIDVSEHYRNFNCLETTAP